MRVLALAVVAKEAAALYWLKAQPGQTCSDACATGCHEEAKYRPKRVADFNHILEALGAKCGNITSAGMEYDPSSDDGRCGFTQGPRPASGFCQARPPPTAARFCPCRGASIGGSLKVHFDLACPQSSADNLYNCTAEQGESNTWTKGRRAWCCCRTGVACPDTATVLRAARDLRVGIPFEKAFAEAVRLRPNIVGLVPPVEEPGTGAASTAPDLQLGFAIDAPTSAELAGVSCERLEEAARSVDWTGTFGQAARKKDLPVPYNLSVTATSCYDRECEVWQWDDAGKRRRLKPEKEKWCCDKRGLGCSISHVWIFVIGVIILNFCALVCIAMGHWITCGTGSSAARGGHKHTLLAQSDTEAQ